MANFAHGKVHYERVPVSGLPPDAPDDDAESGEQDFAKRGAVTPTDGDHYRLSHDDLAALGGGDTEAGHAVLHGVFPFMLQENGVVPFVGRDHFRPWRSLTWPQGAGPIHRQGP